MMKIRYDFVKKTVNDLYIALNLGKYPIEIKSVIKSIPNYKIRVISYSEHMTKYSLSEDEVISHFGSEEGCTIYNVKKDKYLIFYNDLDGYYKVEGRIRWTLSHELGHILLSHHKLSKNTKLFRNNLSDVEYDWMEKEANRFASILLSNPIILYKLNIKDTKDIQNICAISNEASSYRYSDYLKWCKNKYISNRDKIILDNFYKFIYKKHCLACGYGFVSKAAIFCPICGNKKISWGDGNMEYDSYKLDPRGRVLECPRCENRQMTKDGTYCRICGAYLINKCTNDGTLETNNYNNSKNIKNICGMIAEGNSRYCEYCGAPTTFYVQELLKDYTEMLNTRSEVASSINGDMPF